MISNQNTSTDPQLSREEAIEILNTPDENLDELIARAEKLRRKYKGNHVSIHILTNARSGNCSQDCAYCAQSCRSKADIDKYKWVADEKLYADNDFVNEHHLSRHCIGLSGMKFTDAEIEELAEKIRKMKEHGTHLCCSIGFLTEKQALMLKEAGLDRINHNLNSSRAYYHNICSTHTFEQRVANIKMLQGLGFEICSGGIIGMGESKEDVVDTGASRDPTGGTSNQLPSSNSGNTFRARRYVRSHNCLLYESPLSCKTFSSAVRYPLCRRT